MHRQSPSIQNSPISGSLFLNSTQTPPQIDCYYCQIKQKYSVGGQSQKCIAHTIPAHPNNHSPLHSSPSLEQGSDLIEDTIELLGEVEDNLQEYWEELHRHSQGNAKHAQQQIRRVREALAKVQQKLQKFPNQDKQEQHTSPSKRLFKSRQKTDPDQNRPRRIKKQGTTIQYSQLYDEATPPQVVREWVMHFHKIIATRDIVDRVLPLEEELEMKIFKESMERKFANWVQNYDRYERRVGQALERLIYYMETFGSSVNEDVLEADLRFIEEGSNDKVGPGDAEGRAWLMLQAQAIQLLLAKCEEGGGGQDDSFA